MKTRVLSAIVGVVVLTGILICPYVWVFVAAAALLAMIAVWELLYNTHLLSRKCLVFCSMLFAGAEVFLCAYLEPLAQKNPVYAWIPLLVGLLYSAIVIVASSIQRSSATHVSWWKVPAYTLYGTLGFVALACLRMMADGLAYALLPMVISWMSDTGAYFTGYFFGKHKMAPIISPKKTWEGFFGGWVVSVGCAALFGVLYASIAQVQLPVSPLQMAILAVPLAPLSVCGDLLASKIKRQCGIKDYGNIMPGHGGVMDRFDSVIFIAPILWAFLWLLCKG